MNIHLFPNDSNGHRIFSILIPTWNNLPFLKLCIESVRKNSKFAHQLIVHVNDGSDGTLDWVKSQDIDYSWSPKNEGICFPLNACRAMVKTRYIVFLNDDMYVCPSWDYHLLEEITGLHTNLFYVSGTLIEPVKTSNRCCISPKNYGTQADTFEEERLLEEFDSFPHPDWHGASWPPSVVHVDTWDLVGGYSVEFSPGLYSDPDFSMKLYKAGVRIFKGVSNSRVYHFMSKSTGKVVKNNGRKQFLFKWGISARTFYDVYLRMGDAFTGHLPAHLPLEYHNSLVRKGKIKMFIQFFRK